MEDLAIQIEGLSKKYKLGVIGGGTLSQEITSWWARRTGKENPNKKIGSQYVEGEIFWALRDIQLNIREGEIVGIIGKNGAGKSTLLKLLSQITTPSKGAIKIKGRIASLLEVGTGFHPELTGRENIYLNGAILGMRKSEITAKIDQIISFSGIKHHIDTPVKRYSSGMKVRLGFAVAAHLEPEILVVDEVLAVGDAEFQTKCLGKMGEVAQSGRTILFVSHNMGSINRLCSRTIVLENGRIVFDGASEKAIEYYLRSNLADETANNATLSFEKDTKKAFQIRKLTLADESGNPQSKFKYTSGAHLLINFDVHSKNRDHFVVVAIKNALGENVFITSDDDLVPSKISTLDPGSYCYRLRFPSHLLKPGNYYLTISFNKLNAGYIDRKESIMKFEVEDLETRRGEKAGYRSLAIVAPEIAWDLIENKS